MWGKYLIKIQKLAPAARRRSSPRKHTSLKNAQPSSKPIPEWGGSFQEAEEVDVWWYWFVVSGARGYVAVIAPTGDMRDGGGRCGEWVDVKVDDADEEVVRCVEE